MLVFAYYSSIMLNALVHLLSYAGIISAGLHYSQALEMIYLTWSDETSLIALNRKLNLLAQMKNTSLHFVFQCQT